MVSGKHPNIVRFFEFFEAERVVRTTRTDVAKGWRCDGVSTNQSKDLKHGLIHVRSMGSPTNKYTI